MSGFLVLGIYLLLLSDDGEGQGGIVFSMMALLKMRVKTTASAISSAWQHRDFSFQTTTSRRRWCRRHGIIFSGLFSVLLWLDLATMKGLGRIIFRSVFLILRWQKQEGGRHQKEEVSQLRLHECWPPFVGHLFSGLLPSICLCGYPYLVLRSGAIHSMGII